MMCFHTSLLLSAGVVPREPGGRTCAANRILKAGKCPNDAKLHLASFSLCQLSILFSKVQTDKQEMTWKLQGAKCSAIRATWRRPKQSRPKQIGMSSPSSPGLHLVGHLTRGDAFLHFYTFYTFTKQHFLSPFRSFSKGVTGVKPLRKMWHGWSKQALIKAVDTKKQTLFGLNLYYACISAIALCPLHCPSVRVSTELAIHSSGWSRGSYSCLPDKVRSVHVGSGTKQNWSMRIHET